MRHVVLKLYTSFKGNGLASKTEDSCESTSHSITTNVAGKEMKDSLVSDSESKVTAGNQKTDKKVGRRRKVVVIIKQPTNLDFVATDLSLCSFPKLSLREETANEDNREVVTKKYQRAEVEDILCPITLELPFEPVTAEDGRIYEKEAIAGYIKTPRRPDEVSRLGTESGSMTLGGPDSRLHSSDMVFAHTNMGNGFYGVKLRNIYLREGGDSVISSSPKTVTWLGIPEEELNRGQFIVDSGTPDTYFARSFSPFFNKRFKEMSGLDWAN